MENYSLPAIALRGMTVLPGAVVQFEISKKRTVKAIEKAMATDGLVFLIAQRNLKIDEPEKGDLYETGTIAKVGQVVKLKTGDFRVLVEGVQRARLKELTTDDGMFVALVDETDNKRPGLDDKLSNAMILGLREVIKAYGEVNPDISREIISKWRRIKRAESLLDKMMAEYPMDYTLKQEFLEIDDYEQIYMKLVKKMLEDIESYNIKNELTQRVKEKLESNQREYVLREQYNIISEELNGKDANYIDEYMARLEELNASEEIKAEIRKSIKKINNLSGSSEKSVERRYVETLLSLPWNNMSKDNYDEKKAEKLLEKQHYGMDNVKERILESLAVRSLTDNSSDSSIICLVGPPGTGKTSIVRSVAEALDKKYVRVCLGGVRDEAEIRGHRRTYVGAMPGRIIAAMEKVGVNNPVMLLDEIDKVSNDYRSDTASALLEVLDSEQNEHFVDHYVELPVDLSNVLFIATANDLSQISRPLLDRMEIIEVDSYTRSEKLHIAKGHLIPKQLKKNGISKNYLKFTDKAVYKIIDEYTREAGVRELERCIGRICRKVVKSLYENGALRQTDKPVCVNDRNVAKYFDRPGRRSDKINSRDEIGIVRGLAWTIAGGDTLETEVNTMAGKGELILTGNMGDVMKESARIALTYVRSIVSDKKYNVLPEFFSENDIHIHIPEGAVSKDGPSAGVTMATAIASAVTGIKVRRDIAMTGEITIRGRVLAIGGLKEKLIAAKAAGVKKVLVPEENRDTAGQLSNEVTDGLELVFVQNMEQVLEEAFVK